MLMIGTPLLEMLGALVVFFFCYYFFFCFAVGQIQTGSKNMATTEKDDTGLMDATGLQDLH